ncbi:hypothetical protein [Paraburkholderia sp. SIMBA_030]|uniref:hypothetical protein n=1 Tax=Paraburkholderia sp. SIMBA_030 TaxID=3085773 RepID=UPI0039797267
MTIPHATQRMPPVGTVRPYIHVSQLLLMPMLLPQFVGEKPRNNRERHDQKRAQYQLLDHVASDRKCMISF